MMAIAFILSIKASKHIFRISMKTLTDITSNLNTKINTKADSTVITTLASKDELLSGLSGKANSSHRHNWSDIDGKPSIPSNPNSFIVASWRSGANWYRKYSDGFIEQGGAQTVTGAQGEYTMNLNIAFTSTNYTAFCNTYTSMQSNRESCGIKSKATSSFRYYTRTSENGVWRDWVAYGY